MDNFDYLDYIKNNPLLNEIKINNPKDFFYVTEEGKQALENYYKLNEILKFFGEEDPIDFIHSIDNFPKKWFEALHLAIYVDEKLLSINGINKISNFIDRMLNNLGEVETEEEAKDILDELKKLNWIK